MLSNTINESIDILNTPVFIFLEQTFTVGMLIALPVTLVVGVMVIKWLARPIVRKLINRGQMLTLCI